MNPENFAPWLSDLLLIFFGWGFLVAAYGWGRGVLRLTGHSTRSPALTTALGLSLFIFFGGVLNLVHLAYGWALDSVLLTGVLMAARLYRFQSGPPAAEQSRCGLVLIGLIVFAVMSFTISTQFPPEIFNHHDDFEKYFAHPVRMLQTGTLFGSPLSAIGAETLGGQALLHGVMLNHLPAPFINGVDAVFGLMLCLLIAVSGIPQTLRYLPFSLTGLLLVFFINPQYVNISALYLASALVMAALFFSFPAGRDAGKPTVSPPPAVPLGLIYAAMIALKTSLVIFPTIHLMLYMLALIASAQSPRRVIRWGIGAIGAALFFILPWLLVHLPHYYRSSLYLSGRAAAHYRHSLDFFSVRPLYFGDSFAHYTFLCLLIIFPVFAAILKMPKPVRKSVLFSSASLLAGGLSVAAAYLILLLLGPVVNGYPTNLRYAIPILIGGAPVILTRVCLLARRHPSVAFRASFLTAVLLLNIFVLIFFTSSLSERIHKGLAYGTLLAFLRSPPQALFEYNRYVLHGGMPLRIAAAQSRVPSGAALVAWVCAPFYLDFTRNTIYDAEPAGIATPWAYLPDTPYFMIEYRGGAVRTRETYALQMKHPGRHERQIAKKTIKFLEVLDTIKASAVTLYDDGGIIVFRKAGLVNKG